MAKKTAAKRPGAKAKSTASRARGARTSADTATSATASATGTSTAAVAPAASSHVTVRHYLQGIGDCHLLKFRKQDGGDFFMLIDCGVHSSVTGGSDMIKRIVDDIATVTRHIDVVAATHEHWDHLSGFLTAAENFKAITFGEAWMGWTENPADPQARQLDKFKTQAVAALQATNASLDHASGLSPHLEAVRDGVKSMLGFQFGAKGEKVRDARDAILGMTEKRVKYLEATKSPLDLPGVPNLRIFVLGPPRDAKLLGLTERASEMYGLAGGGWPLAVALSNAFGIGEAMTLAEGDYAMPFDPNYGMPLSELVNTTAPVPVQPSAPASGAGAPPIAATLGNVADKDSVDRKRLSDFLRAHYLGDDQAWRRVDADWLGASADLAIQMDSRTNNSSLVLAFEFTDTKRVLLFVGDAQVGNWLSWQDLKWTLDGADVTGPDLLARTVFYKVGHHGSHNATLKEKGLELMKSADLAAFIPTNAKDALKVKWGAMPFQPILDDLETHCQKRVIRADDPWVATEDTPDLFKSPSGVIKAVRHKAGLWVELDLA
jgi:hypothetical protein